MYQSTTYAGQRSKSVFAEMSERSAETARLLQQAREAQPEQKCSLGRRAVSRLAHLLQRKDNRMAQRPADARS
jgi:hypothetical protein